MLSSPIVHSLQTCFKEAASSLLDEKRKSAIGFIRVMFIKIDQLTKEIIDLDRQKAKKQKTIDDTLARIEKLKAGDWSVLQENAQKAPSPEQETD